MVQRKDPQMPQSNTRTGLIGAFRGCASWQDIQAKWRTLPEKQKGDLFEELVKAYLHLPCAVRMSRWLCWDGDRFFIPEGFEPPITRGRSSSGGFFAPPREFLLQSILN
jgi:hypothetical protein